MPGFDGTGQLGQGPMTGRGQGFCVLTTSKENPSQLEGFAGLQAVPIVGQKVNNFESLGKEVINMPFGNGTGPASMGPMTGRAAGFCAGYPVPGYMNPVGGRGFFGRGRGFGGGGWGRRNWYYATGLPGWARAGYGMPAYGGAVNPYAYGGVPFAPGLTAQQELDGLKGQAEYLEDSLDGIKKRIEELESQKSSKD